MPERIVIVGGVAGGMSAATRARRMNESASITVLEKGGFVSFANCGLPYYLGGQIESQEKLLVAMPRRLKDRFNIDVRVRHEVMRIDRTGKTVEALDHASGRTHVIPYDKLILAVGAVPIVPRIEHVRAANVFLLRSMEDTQAVRDWLEAREPKRAAIVGAGFIGLEMAEAMRRRGLDVTVIEKAPHALPPLDAEMAAFVGAELNRNGVKLIVGSGLAALRAGEHKQVNAVVLEDARLIDAEVVLLSIGVRPNVKLAEDANLTIGPSGAIAADVYQRTNDPEIYAVGDVAEVIHGVTHQPVRIPLAGPANRQGRLAGEHAATGSAPRAGPPIGTAIVKVFDLAVGLTGLSERDARRNQIDVDAAYVMPSNHAGYYPGAQQMRIKLVYEKVSGRIVGAQAIGGEGVDKRIDVIATAIHFRGTIDDLSALDLAYAPQFGAAKDPVHIAAFVAQNQQRGLMDATSSAAENEAEQLIDVRSPQEFAAGSLKGAINIPIENLRDRLNELDPALSTLTFCQIGQRGYVAQRILAQHGFGHVRNLKGGYALASAATAVAAQRN